MAQQQLLLIILATIVVGIAVAVGISMFADAATSANRDGVSNDLVNLAARAQQYFRRPASLGVGGNSFVGLTADAAGLAKLTNMASGKNANGTYTIQAAGTANQVTIQGVGTELVAGNKVTMQILSRDAGRTDSLVQVY